MSPATEVAPLVAAALHDQAMSEQLEENNELHVANALLRNVGKTEIIHPPNDALPPPPFSKSIPRTSRRDIPRSVFSGAICL